MFSFRLRVLLLFITNCLHICALTTHSYRIVHFRSHNSALFFCFAVFKDTVVCWIFTLLIFLLYFPKYH